MLSTKNEDVVCPSPAGGKYKLSKECNLHTAAEPPFFRMQFASLSKPDGRWWPECNEMKVIWVQNGATLWLTRCRVDFGILLELLLAGAAIRFTDISTKWQNGRGTSRVLNLLFRSPFSFKTMDNDNGCYLSSLGNELKNYATICIHSYYSTRQRRLFRS